MMLGTFCAICGYPSSTGRPKDLFLEDKVWRQSYNKNALYVDPKKLENKYFMRNPRNWESLYRLIMYDRSTETFRISGIGHCITEHDYLRPPLDKDKAMIGDPDEHERELARYYHLAVNFWCDYYHQKTNWRDVAIAVHMRCWDLTERIFGLSVYDHLGLFLAVTLQTAVRIGLPTWPEIEIGRQDPSRHPETNRLVQKALKRRHKQRQQNKDKLLPSSCRLSFLPLDVVWLLFNCLDYYDLWNLVNAVQFPIPDRYLPRRANVYLDLMDDVNELELDRPFLCLELERLHAILGIFTTRIWVIDDIDRLSVKFNDELRKKRRIRPAAERYH